VTDTLAIGTPTKLWRYERQPGQSTPTYHFYRVNGLIDAAITSLKFDSNGVLYIGNKEAMNFQNPDLTFKRIGGGPGGIPYGNITAIGTSQISNSVWLGSTYGVMKYDNGTWRYFNGPRYLTDQAFGPGNSIFALAVGVYNGMDSVLVSTGTGLSWFHFLSVSLDDKATFFQTLVKPYHDRFGLTASAGLSNWGDMSSFYLQSSENDGLWTGMYLASQALRYAVTKDPDAKREADIALEGLELLNNVTGVSGLFARSVLNQSNLPVRICFHILIIDSINTLFFFFFFFFFF
jgi:hypothetical protein